jgi:hypothetical protein
MATWDATNHYFSGQGVVLMGERDATGKPKALRAVGNVSSLKIGVTTSVLEHKESQTGARGTDLRLTTEIKASLSMVMENYIARNLASALRGSYVEMPGTTMTDDAVNGFAGAVSPLDHIKVSNFVLEQGATALTAYTNDSTPYDYKVNLDAGSFELNDGSVLAHAGLSLGVAITGITVGATTSFAAAGHTVALGDQILFRGFTGADAADINGKTGTVTTVVAGVSFAVNINTATKTITLGSGKAVNLTAAIALLATYDYADQFRVDALTEGAPTLYLRFEGLNTAENNDPVVIEVFSFSTDPLKELDLISDGVQQFTLEGSVLADPLQPTGSKYWKITKLN